MSDYKRRKIIDSLSLRELCANDEIPSIFKNFLLFPETSRWLTCYLRFSGREKQLVDRVRSLALLGSYATFASGDSCRPNQKIGPVLRVDELEYADDVYRHIFYWTMNLAVKSFAGRHARVFVELRLFSRRYKNGQYLEKFQGHLIQENSNVRRQDLLDDLARAPTESLVMQTVIKSYRMAKDLKYCLKPTTPEGTRCLRVIVTDDPSCKRCLECSVLE